ncbi:60S ribosomal protein L31, partial [Myotis davidii]
AMSQAVPSEQATYMHTSVQGAGSRKGAPRALRDLESATREMETPDEVICTRSPKLPGQRNCNVRDHIWVRSSRKHNEGDESPNEFYTLVTYVPVSTFKNQQTVNMDEN